MRGGQAAAHQVCPTYTQEMEDGSGGGEMQRKQQYLPHEQGRGEELSYPYMSGSHTFPNNLPPNTYTSNKRHSTNTLSTISEVRQHSTSCLRTLEAGRRGSTGGVGGEMVLNLDRNGGSVVPPAWFTLPPRPPPHHQQQQQQLGVPPPSATESIKSHWSDDSEDDKKGANGLFTLVKSTRDSLTRKSSKGSRTSSNKTEKASVGGKRESL
ncbi:hypothetical protein CBS101457_003992 [Exobasidium rhododendri]|nr:hypothetical protein CBS101457_003992 [Exobasidium rhododendri]